VEESEKLEIFKKELSWIEDAKIREFAETAVSRLPDYFFRVQASSTGKYHPAYALGDGGLVRHTKAAVGIAHLLLGLEMYDRWNAELKDLIIAALILHDGMKHGLEESKYVKAEHPMIVADWIANDRSLNKSLTIGQLHILTGLIRSHMGQWNADYKTKKAIMPKPAAAEQRFVHICDYLASRKSIIYDFNAD
jgi:hypothetical protein